MPIRGEHIIAPIIDQLAADSYESPEIRAIQAMLRPDDRVLELGVGIGVVSALAAKSCPKVEIVSYEANPQLIEPIKRLHDLNGITNISLRNAVLVPGAGGGTRQFFFHPSFAEGSLQQTSESLESTDVAAHGFAETLESMKPTFLIMDIEGGEGELLRGADLKGIRVFVLELHPKILSPEDIKGIFDACITSGLYPRIELSSDQVMAFERIP